MEYIGETTRIPRIHCGESVSTRGLKLCRVGLRLWHVGLYRAYCSDGALLGNNDCGTMLSKSRIQTTTDWPVSPIAERVAERALDWRKMPWVLLTHWPQTCWD